MYKYESNGYIEKSIWDASVGLQRVDGLKPSKYMLGLIQENISKKLTVQEIEKLLYDYHEKTEDDSKEADIVSKRIAELLSGDAFTFSPAQFIGIHKYLFSDIMPEYAGVIRQLNLKKEEPILNGNTVKYANWNMIGDQMSYDFDAERRFGYSGLDFSLITRHLAEFTRNLWQTHPFMEGNTRTTAVFMELYLNSKGFKVDNTLFAEKSLYFRNALVRANYADYLNKVYETTMYLEKFYENLLFNGTHELTNKELICFSLFPNKEVDVEQNPDDSGFDPGEDE